MGIFIEHLLHNSSEQPVWPLSETLTPTGRGRVTNARTALAYRTSWRKLPRLTSSRHLLCLVFRGFLKPPDTCTDDSSTMGFWAKPSALLLWDFNFAFIFPLSLAIWFYNLHFFYFCPAGIPACHRGPQPGSGRCHPPGHHAQKRVPRSPMLRLLPAQGAAEVRLPSPKSNRCHVPAVLFRRAFDL